MERKHARKESVTTDKKQKTTDKKQTNDNTQTAGNHTSIIHTNSNPFTPHQDIHTHIQAQMTAHI